MNTTCSKEELPLVQLLFVYAAGILLFAEAVHIGEYLRVMVAVDLIDRLAQVTQIRTSPGQQSVANVT